MRADSCTAWNISFNGMVLILILMECVPTFHNGALIEDCEVLILILMECLPTKEMQQVAIEEMES